MKKRIFSFALAAAMLISLVPVTACAEEAAPAADATVYLTVSNQGTLATANDGSMMVEKPVTVKDLNADGVLTYDEALTAAHETYNSADGYSAPGGYVAKLWGVDTYNSLYFDNGVGLLEGVGTAQIQDGDHLTASINADNTYYADWYTSFDQTAVTAQAGEEITLTLTGYQGMMGGTPAAVSGVSVGTVENGTFTAIENAVTDENGTVVLRFDEAGTYYVSASGTVKDTVTVDWTTYETAEADCPIIAPYCVVTVNPAPVSISFTDVADDDWFASFVGNVAVNGWMVGTTANTFAPHTVVTREMAIQVLYSLAGKTEVSGTTEQFSDVETGKWYSDAITWAAENGITAGYGDGSFGVGDPVTREQLAVFFHQFAKGAEGADTRLTFTDTDQISAWAMTDVQWAVGQQLFAGCSDGSFAPQKNTERCELAVVISAYEA